MSTQGYRKMIKEIYDDQERLEKDLRDEMERMEAAYEQKLAQFQKDDTITIILDSSSEDEGHTELRKTNDELRKDNKKINLEFKQLQVHVESVTRELCESKRKVEALTEENTELSKTIDDAVVSYQALQTQIRQKDNEIVNLKEKVCDLERDLTVHMQSKSYSRDEPEGEFSL